MEYKLQLNTPIKCLTPLNTLVSYLAVACILQRMAKKCIEIFIVFRTIVPLTVALVCAVFAAIVVSMGPQVLWC